MQMVCKKKHFGAGGKLVEVGTTKNGKPDGVFWAPAEGGGKVEVATPGNKKPSAQEVVAQIKESEDAEFLESMMEDNRKTVSDAAVARLEELEQAGNGEEQ